MSESTAPLGETLDSILARLAKLESAAGIKSGTPAPAASASSSSASSSSSSSHPAVAAYDKYLEEKLGPFVAACDDLGDRTKVLGEAVSEAWRAQGAFLAVAVKCKKPSDQTALGPFFKPYQAAMAKVNPGRDDWEFHEKTIKESFGILQWIMMPSKPKDYILEMIGACDFWSNKIRIKYKKTEPKQIAWCDALKGLLNGLAEYVKGFHLAGVAYDMTGKGGDLPSDAPAAAAPAAAKPKPKAPAAAGGAGGLLAELAKKKSGDSAATGLKKVTKDQQTWRKEFSGGDANPPPAPKPKPKPAAASKFGASKKPLGPPVFQFQDQGMKWIVENQTADTNPNGVLTVEVTDPKHQVYIYKCENATIDIKGKCKAVVVDTCTKSNVLCDTCISAVELVNGKRMKVQVRGVCPSIAIDKTDGCLTYLSAETASLTTFVTSKSSEMNVSWPDANGDYKEKAIPEQFQHKLDVESGSISSDISDLYSH
ncbi:hypothetical protein TrCOL_g7605 [Triparma columacea]|uniref:C-CAP/cofactor C-like domain-containing protein n=1 Tax=Triparma columacea TaxID=722753 RepID=A0A9W7GMG7_9STRA|nr:hypothetical protein TrCOL_g7605 [Triparma columacea]